jgi:cellulose synthase/poly-beta-1,6-N-acetylglucosamine synthase-like glycosyltransferase
MISVCIATYNGQRFIGRQITSILSQLEEGDEVIVSDDGSTDETLSVINQLGDPRIRIIEGPHRHSPVWNFENALKHAKGDFIFLSDQDDLWMLDKVEVTMRWLQKYDCVVSDCRTMDAEERVLEGSFYAVNGTRSGKYYNLLVKNGYLGCCMAFRRNVLKASLPFPPDIPMHDIWIGNVAAFRYSVCFIADKLMHYRRHGDNASTASSPSAYSLSERLRFRWIVARDIHQLKRKGL